MGGTDDCQCDSLDVAVLWPCQAQVGIIPLPEFPTVKRPKGKLFDEDEERG